MKHRYAQFAVGILIVLIALYLNFVGLVLDHSYSAKSSVLYKNDMDNRRFRRGGGRLYIPIDPFVDPSSAHELNKRPMDCIRNIRAVLLTDKKVYRPDETM